TLSGAPPSNFVNGVILGASASTWIVFNLPMTLAAFGFPGCSLFQSPDVSISPVPANGLGNAVLPAPIPPTPALVGASLYVQRFSVTAPPLAFANGAQVIMG